MQSDSLWLQGKQYAVEQTKQEFRGDIPDAVRSTAERIILNAHYGIENGPDHTPKVVAASSEYLSRIFEENRTPQKEIAEKYELSTVPIREAYQTLVDSRCEVDISQIPCRECSEVGLVLAFAHPDISTSGATQDRGYIGYTNLICPECGEIQSGEYNAWGYEH